MTSDTLLELFRDAMGEVIDDVPDDVTLDSRIVDIGLDSLDLVEIVLVLEEKLQVASRADDFDDVTTVGAAVAVFERLVAQEAERV